ncbi:MAG: helix-turn-helix domain-containing protein [Planctomycetes bacterium]|nr:helix-turn-helix domain-containing protein [Planctomycetota bacterium]
MASVAIASRPRAARRPHHARPIPRGVPYTMRLPDERTLFVEVPARMAVRDRGGELAFTPEGVEFLDRLRALASEVGSHPSPALIATLRRALGFTQEQLGKRLGVHKLTVSRWECGGLHPSAEAVSRLRALANAAKRTGVIVPECAGAHA